MKKVFILLSVASLMAFAASCCCNNSGKGAEGATEEAVENTVSGCAGCPSACGAENAECAAADSTCCAQ